MNIAHTFIEETLDLYYQLCSLEVTAKTQAIMGACLANGGINPLNFKRIIPEQSVGFYRSGLSMRKLGIP